MFIVLCSIWKPICPWKCFFESNFKFDFDLRYCLFSPIGNTISFSWNSIGNVEKLLSPPFLWVISPQSIIKKVKNTSFIISCIFNSSVLKYLFCYSKKIFFFFRKEHLFDNILHHFEQTMSNKYWSKLIILVQKVHYLSRRMINRCFGLDTIEYVNEIFMHWFSFEFNISSMTSCINSIKYISCITSF